jgi:hypothetical protein
MKEELVPLEKIEAIQENLYDSYITRSYKNGEFYYDGRNLLAPSEDQDDAY